MDNGVGRDRQVEEAFAWESDYDKVLALAHLVREKAEQQNLTETDLSEAELVAVIVPQFSAEIANGGFHQFFTNPLGDRWPEVLHALTMIGAANIVQLLNAAMAVFPGNMPSKNNQERFDVLAKCTEAELARLSAQDEAYYRQGESLFVLAAEYLRKHKQSFL